MNDTRYGNDFVCLTRSGQQPVPAHSRRQGKVLIYVKMNIKYDQIVSKGGWQKATSVLVQVQIAGQTVVMSWNSFSSTETFNFKG